jgi:hypothetical protein
MKSERVSVAGNRVGKSRDIVTPGVVEVVIEQDGWKQAEFEG